MTQQVTVRNFSGKQMECEEVINSLSSIEQAGLRQFSLERMIGYGMDYADAIEFRSRILTGAEWVATAEQMADELVRLISSNFEHLPNPMGRSVYKRSSAMLRMGQMMMLGNTPTRAAMYEKASELYQKAIACGLNRHRTIIEGANGPLVGWLIKSQNQPAIGTAIVFGGIEGWAIDFDSIGEELANMGVNALLLDCPGQGETRFAHDHYLTAHWKKDMRAVVDWVEQNWPEAPVGLVGNSMGGSVALAFAGSDPRIIACCNNGGVMKPSAGRNMGGAFYKKMCSFCGTEDEDEAARIWETVDPLLSEGNKHYALLAIQGGRDPLVANEHAETLMAAIECAQKEMVVFSDGDHCIYNHRTDRDLLIANWMRRQLSGNFRKTSELKKDV